ncbi:hypothetical protein [Cupriavidus basilensis]|uniref:hypothetical protein n=1 Tax=Cupriavidus basilensis TaxID=68895 RepID=UPI00031974A2|nr:hypothetical protein [Cupriavidus basilensis]
MEKISLSLPGELRQQIETARRDMSQRVGAELSMSQAAQALLRRALDHQPNDSQPAAG